MLTLANGALFASSIAGPRVTPKPAPILFARAPSLTPGLPVGAVLTADPSDIGGAT